VNELKPREAVRRMAPYSPPTEDRAGKLRLDFNENTIGSSPAVVEFLRDKLSAERLSIYPEYREARKELAAFFEVAENELLITNGTDEAIQVLINTYLDAGDDVLLVQPSYAMYRFYAELAGAALREVRYRPRDLSFPLEELLFAIRPLTRAILIANPNNPTGTGIGLSGIEQIVAQAPNASVLVDEAYFDFSGVTALPMLSKYPNLFISRTFSKSYGMAAMRCGVLFSQSQNIKWMRKAQSPYSVNTLAVLAARAAVRDRESVEEYVHEVLAARELAYAGLKRLGIPAFPSQGNFLLFDAGSRAIPIRDALRERGVLVRDRSYEIPGAIRVTIGNREQIQKFLNELEKLWNA
jgi:histidinol-phosphate aminotransferase